MSLADAAQLYAKHGLSPIPIGADRVPMVKWEMFQKRIAAAAEIHHWWARPQKPDVGVVCGSVSGCLEVIDFDLPGLYDAWRNRLKEASLELWEKVDEARVVETPSGGRHIYLSRKGGTVPGNRVLAWSHGYERKGKTSYVKLETRGEGGYVICPPTRGYRDVGGGKIPALTDEEWDVLDRVGAVFSDKDTTPKVSQGQVDETPWDAFRARGPSIEEMLERAGWTRTKTRSDGAVMMRRPGKDGREHSATIGVGSGGGDPVLTVFSSSTSFEQRRSYSKVDVWIHLQGLEANRKEAWRRLRQEGYGTPPRRQVQPPQTPQSGRRDPPPPENASQGIFEVRDQSAYDLTSKLPPRAYLLETAMSETQRGASEPCGVLPAGRVGMLAAEGGAGKSMLLTQLGLAVADGHLFVGSYRPCLTGRVFLGLGEEEFLEGERRIIQAGRLSGMGNARYRAARAKIALHCLAGKPLAMLLRAGKTHVWRELLTQLADHEWTLIVIDPLSRWGGADVEHDEYVATEFVSMLEHLTTLPGSPTVLLAHHTNKGARGGIMTTSAAARGTSALTDAVRWQANLEALPKVGDLPSMCRLRVVKSNIAKIPAPITLVREDAYDGLMRLALGLEKETYWEARLNGKDEL